MVKANRKKQYHAIVTSIIRVLHDYTCYICNTFIYIYIFNMIIRSGWECWSYQRYRSDKLRADTCRHGSGIEQYKHMYPDIHDTTSPYYHTPT